MSNEHLMGNQPPLNVPVDVLAADVSRLQNANVRLHHEKDELRAEVERLRAANELLVKGLTEMRDGTKAGLLGIEAKTAAFVDWLKRREDKIDAIKQATIEDLPKAVCELEAWEQENPKP